MAQKQRHSAKGRGFGRWRLAEKGASLRIWRKNVPGFRVNRRGFVGGFRLEMWRMENYFGAA